MEKVHYKAIVKILCSASLQTNCSILAYETIQQRKIQYIQTEATSSTEKPCSRPQSTSSKKSTHRNYAKRWWGLICHNQWKSVNIDATIRNRLAIPVGSGIKRSSCKSWTSTATITAKTKGRAPGIILQFGWREPARDCAKFDESTFSVRWVGFS